MELARTKNDEYPQSNESVVNRYGYMLLVRYKFKILSKVKFITYILRALKYPKPLTQKLGFLGIYSIK